MQMKSVTVQGKMIGDDQPVYIIAEMAWSHDGSVENAKAIIKGAADAGADAISVHITSVKDYMVRNYGSAAGKGVSAGKEQEVIYNYLESINPQDADWEELFAYARSLGLAVCAMPNDIQSLRLCKKLEPDAYVIAAACFIEEEFVSEVAGEMKPVILRIGGATLGETESTVNLIRQQGSGEMVLLHGFQSYPTRIEDTHLNLLPTLKIAFQLPVGLADHVDAESPLALIVPLVALASGASVIEKHVTHDRKLKGEDFESALNPDELKQFVGYTREVEKSFGSSSFTPLSEAEKRYREVSRKRTVATRLIKKGEKIAREDITFKRADDGIYPDEIGFVVGRTAKEDIKEDTPIIREMIS
jgi:sialic acid synthase SpsE